MPVVSLRPGETLSTPLPASSGPTGADNSAIPPLAEQNVPTSSWAERLKNTPGYKADKELAASFADAMVNAAGRETGNSYDEPVVPVPPDSMFAQWRQQLDALLASPDFEQWADFNNIDRSKPIRIAPADGTSQAHIVAALKSDAPREKAPLMLFAAGQGKTLPHTWLLIMQAASTLSPNGHSLEVPAAARASSGVHAERPASIREIANFYGEALPSTQQSAVQRANQLKQADSFPAADSSLSTAQFDMRADEMLEHQQKTLGDMRNDNRLFQQLSNVLDLIDADAEPDETRPSFITTLPTPEATERAEKANIKDLLKSTHLEIDPSSWYFQDEQLIPEDTVTLEQFIHDKFGKVPETRAEILNLIGVLRQTEPATPLHGNYTGALGWEAPVSASEQKELYSHIAYNNLQLPGLSAGKKTDAFNYLTKNRHWTSTELRNPAHVLSQILASPKARELEASLQKKMGAAEDPDSSDWVLAAMLLGLDAPTWLGTPKKANQTAGFDLADKAFHGKPLDTIKQALVDHLVQTQRASQEMAPVAAHLLLASAAPELQVKDIPKDVTYGSPAWFSLKATVAYIEAKHPGSSSLMSFAEVVKYGEVNPISDDDQALLNEVKQAAVIDWALAYGVLKPSATGEYSAQQLNAAHTTFTEVMTGLKKIAQDLNAPVPLQKSMALEVMGQHIKNVPFEAAVITNPQSRTNNALNDGPLHVNTGPYSLLDMYLSEHAPSLKDDNTWYSLNPSKVPDGSIKLLGDLPDIKPLHRDAVANYQQSRDSGLVNLTKHLIAQLPIEDRHHLEFGKLDLFIEGTVIKHTSYTQAGNINHDQPFPEQENDKRSLIVRATDGDSVRAYEFCPQENRLKPLSDFKPGLQGEWTRQPAGIIGGDKFSNTAIVPFDVPAGVAGSLDATTPGDGAVPASYTSARSQFLGELLARHTFGKSPLDEWVSATGHTTRFSEEDQDFEHSKELLLGSIPGVNLVRNVVKGDWLAVAADLIFDGVMYATTAGLGGGFKGVKTLRAATKRTRQTFGNRLFNRSRALTSSTPTTDFDRLLRGRTGRNDLSKFATRPDVAEGTYRKNGATFSVSAKLDKKTGKIHAFDPVKNRTYGKPLENFTPHKQVDDAVPGTSRSSLTGRERALDTALGRDNVIQMGGKMKALNMIGNKIHTFTDEYKNLSRLNIVAHGTERDWVDNLFGSGTKVCIDDKYYGAKDLIKLLRSKKVDPASFNTVRLLICHSAEGRSRSFARLFQKEIKRPVKAFEGTVSVAQNSTYITTQRNIERASAALSNKGADATTLNFIADNALKKRFVNKIITRVEKDHGAKIKINIADVDKPDVLIDGIVTYQPRWFKH
ncbi:hypothetical protein [Pseudomonas sp. MWU15-20650]|uniref:hypothetical protein n=1 Tax=Pseudomonas sp. MWU15-20650 TaxID=2933107 RepID=UPI00200F4471|nr:hypothetical protein [Pseudomonas sp. MWU15-20650]